MTKIFYGRDEIGRFKCDGKRYSRFQLFRMKVTRMIRNAMIGGVVVSVVGWVAVGAFYYAKSNIVPITVFAEDMSQVLFETKVDSLKDSIVSQLIGCESAGHKESDGIIIFDTNNKASVGQLQFQVDTVVYYYKTLYKQDLTRKEAVMIALDTEKASNLAKDIIFTTKNKVGKDWTNCERKLNLDAKVDVIKAIEK